MRRASRHVQVDHALDLRWPGRVSRGEGIGHRAGGRARLSPKQARKRDRAETELAGGFQEVPPSDGLQLVEVWVHRRINISSKFNNTFPTVVQAANSTTSAPAGA